MLRIILAFLFSEAESILIDLEQRGKDEPTCALKLKVSNKNTSVAKKRRGQGAPGRRSMGQSEISHTGQHRNQTVKEARQLFPGLWVQSIRNPSHR